VPSLAYSHALDARQSLGIALYGNGGTNTDCDERTFGFAPAGVDLEQMFVASTYARRLDERNALGVSPILAWQRFRATGLAAFGGFSSSATTLTDNGYASAFGGGIRAGYVGHWTPCVSFAASYQSRIWRAPFDKHAGLFAEKGDFDVPSNWVAGIAILPAKNVDVALDVQPVRYSEVKSVANPLLPNLTGNALGTSRGAGFGWNDVTTVKAGAQLRTGDGWTWRVGYSYGQQPIPESEVLFNILAPGVIRQHASLGCSKQIGHSRRPHLALTRAFSQSVEGPNALEAPGQQKIALRMDEWDVEVGVGATR
jgi:long-chain fatty acid transport protein